MTLTFTYTFDDPFYTGGAVSSDVPHLFPVAIDGHPYLVDVKKYRRRTLPALRPPQDNQLEPGEQSLNTEGFWRRTQSDWSLGAGQDYFDLDDSNRRRFSSSKGVNVWTRNRLSLLPDTALRQASANTNLKLLNANGYFYMVDGTALKFTTTPDAPSWTTVTTTGLGTITGLTTTGSTVYASDGVKVMQGAAGGAALANLGATTPDFLFFANGRLIGMDADLVYELVAAGTKTDIKDHDNASFVWNSCVGAPNGIYVGGNSGDRAEIYYVGVNTSTGALTAAVHALAPPFGETLNTMCFYEGVIVLGTSKGFRVASINADNSLAHGPLIAITNGVAALEPQGQYVWFAWKNYDGTSTGLGRLNLAEFTAPLVPSYATDLMATAQGSVQSIASMSDKRYFAVSAAGMYGESTNKVTSGTLDSGFIQFSTVERKMVSSIDFKFDALAGTIDATVTDDISNSTAIAAITTASSTEAGPMSLGIFGAETFSVNLTLTRASGATTTGPTLHRWTLRAIAAPFRTDEFIVPLILWQKVDNPIGEGQDVYFNPYDEFQTLKQLEADRAVIRYQEGSATYNVYIDGIEVQPDKWMDEHEFFQGIVAVRMLTVETTESS